VSSQRYRLPRPPTNMLTVVFAIVAVFFGLAFAGKALEGYRVHRHNVILQAEISALEEQQEQLRERLEYVQTSAYVEQVAREQYKWTRDGETLVIPVFRQSPAPQASPMASPQPAASAHEDPPTSYWQEWWSLLTAPLD